LIWQKDCGIWEAVLAMVLESKEILVCGVFCVFLRAGLCLVLSLGQNASGAAVLCCLAFSLLAAFSSASLG